MKYSSIIPTNAPKNGRPSQSITVFSNKENKKLYKENRITQSASCLVEEQNHVLGNFERANGFVSTINLAFSDHLPLLIIPDDIWHIFLAQVSLIIGKDPEKYRNSFVNHQGKEKIDVRNDILTRDNIYLSKQWESIFPIFEQKMNEKMKLNMNRIFSTTTKTHYTTSLILIMDAMKDYLEYSVSTMCGFPEIRIGGNVYDWDTLDKSIEDISKRLETTIFKELNKFINECKKVINNTGDPNYWEKLYHWEGHRESGQVDKTTGIVNDLFPIDKFGKITKYHSGIPRPVDTFPSISGTVPFIWHYNPIGKLEENIECEFYAGLTHVGWDNEHQHVYCKPSWKIYRIENKE